MYRGPLNVDELLAELHASEDEPGRAFLGEGRRLRMRGRPKTSPLGPPRGTQRNFVGPSVISRLARSMQGYKRDIREIIRDIQRRHKGNIRRCRWVLNC